VNLRRFGMIGIVSGTTAATIVLVALAASSSTTAAGKPSAGTVDVVVATSFVAPGTPLSTQQLAIRPVQADMLPEGALTSIQEAVGRAAAVPLFRNDPIVQGRLSGGSTGAASTVQPGRTVFALPIDPARAVGGLIVGGDRIAIITVGTGRGDSPSVLMPEVAVLGAAGDPPFSTAESARSGAAPSSGIAAPAPATRTGPRILLLDTSLEQATQLASLIDSNKYYVALRSRPGGPEVAQP
jgi:Flp pilus assembly protein CpaB